MININKNGNSLLILKTLLFKMLNGINYMKNTLNLLKKTIKFLKTLNQIMIMMFKQLLVNGLRYNKSIMMINLNYLTMINISKNGKCY